MADFPSIPRTQWEDWNPLGPSYAPLREESLHHQGANVTTAVLSLTSGFLVSFRRRSPSSPLKGSEMKRRLP